jgi:hypothetical protein
MIACLGAFVRSYVFVGAKGSPTFGHVIVDSAIPAHCRMTCFSLLIIWCEAATISNIMTPAIARTDPQPNHFGQLFALGNY